jgi:FG-GAP-like repeat
MGRAAFWAALVTIVAAVTTAWFVYWVVAQPPGPASPAANSVTAAAEGTLTFQPRPIGLPVTAGERPLIAHVAPVDLDRDGLLDVIACDLLKNRVVWIRQAPAGTFTESDLGEVIAAPAHAEPVDLDKDGDLDILVASLGVLFPSNAKIGSVVVLENDGKGRFTNRVLLQGVARVSDVRAGDLDGDGDLDLAVAQFGYNEGQTRWMRNDGRWRFSSTVLQNLSGPINVEIADLDGDGDLDITSLVSQEWEEIYAYVNGGRGQFSSRLIWGSTNDDFGSSWLAATDLDRDGDVDFLYSNGDAFDYSAGGGRPWHGLQWLENRGGLTFDLHRIADIPGAMSPRSADLDGDGDLDVAVVSAYNDWDNPSAQSLVWLENDGHQAFRLHGLANAPTHLITLGVGDLDGDGRIDLVTGGLHASRPYDRMSRISWWTREAQWRARTSGSASLVAMFV